MKEFVFYCNWGCYFDGERYFIDPVHLKYLDEINKRDMHVILVTKESEVLETKVKVPNHFEIQLLPTFKGYVNAFSIFNKLIFIAKTLSLTKKNYYIRYPEPFAWLFIFFSHPESRLGLHLMSNPFKAILGGGNKFLAYLKVLGYLPSFLLNILSARFSKKTVFTCNGEGLSTELNLQYLNVRVLNESTLDEKDFYYNNILEERVSTKLLYVGFLREAKGVQFLITALDLLHKGGFSVTLDVVGDGPFKKELQAQLSTLGIDYEVKFFGHIPFGIELIKLYRNSDIFILPSLTEGSPRVIIEAMANSLPVISTSVGNIPNLLSEGRGICIPPGKVQPIVESVVKLIHDKSLGVDFIDKSFSYSKTFTISHFFDEFLGSVDDS